MIEVRLFATFREGRGKKFFLDPEEFKNTGEILAHLRIPREEVAILLKNGQSATTEDFVKDGDVISLFPPAGGG